jgi:hypothetical protein
VLTPEPEEEATPVVVVDAEADADAEPESSIPDAEDQGEPVTASSGSKNPWW